MAAIYDADYATAIQKLMAMKARLASTPNLTRSLGGGGSQSISWNPSELDSLIKDCRQQQAAAAASTGGIFQTSKVTYARAGTE
ncbi:MAG TPA: hypothetical protein ENH89_03205 [Aurantimonas coralicida]|uniref:Uncharacterized protein n=1 Tax=Aurantimonas coralicida TaxID=182270 RepID=A0A9C9TG50_9HYPH|nr:hypothetical protein [Aurantimonas coralicida]